MAKNSVPASGRGRVEPVARVLTTYLAVCRACGQRPSGPLDAHKHVLAYPDHVVHESREYEVSAK